MPSYCKGEVVHSKMATWHAQRMSRSDILLSFCALIGALLWMVFQCMCKRIRNISVVCIVRCITAATPSVRTGWCQGPAPGNPKELFVAISVLGRQKTMILRYTLRRIFGNFPCPACQHSGR